MRRVTADSNILISALQYGGKPLTLLDMAQDGRVLLAISSDILNETLRILRDKFGWSSERLQETRSHLQAITTMAQPQERIDAVRADPDDNRILECAVAATSDVVVSGDTHLLELGSFRGIAIVTVNNFLQSYPG